MHAIMEDKEGLQIARPGRQTQLQKMKNFNEVSLLNNIHTLLEILFRVNESITNYT